MFLGSAIVLKGVCGSRPSHRQATNASEGLHVGTTLGQLTCARPTVEQGLACIPRRFMS